jgi:hypothetical protein
VGLVARKAGLTHTESSPKTLFFALKQHVPAWSEAEFGRDYPTTQLRFANSRG